MKTGFNKIWLAITLLLFTSPAFAIATIVAAAQAFAAWYATAGIVVQFAVQLVASAIISRVFAPDAPSFDGTRYPDPGNRQQLPPATDNKLPVVYGSAYVGGAIVDLSITNNNQQIYYVLALSEVTNSENGNTGDVFSFGDVYWGGKKVIFSTTVGETYKVTGLLDESSGLVDTSVAGLMEFYFYRNGSNTPTNSALSAITVMSNPNLSYQWDATKLMSNCAFVIIKLTYSSDANITGMQQTKFQVINPRANPGDCFLDYFRSTRYGASGANTRDKIDDATILIANASMVCPIVKAATVVLNIAATIIEPGILFNPCFL